MLKVAYIIATVAFAALAEAIFPVVTLGAASGAVTTGIGASTVIAGLAAALGAGLAGASLLGRGGRGNSGGYGGYRGGRGYRGGYRGRREAALESEQIFAEMEALDSIDDCGKLYLCQLATLEKAKLNGEEQQLIEALQPKKLKVESASSPFQMAVQLGLQFKSRAKCQTRYARCVLFEIEN